MLTLASSCTGLADIMEQLLGDLDPEWIAVCEVMPLRVFFLQFSVSFSLFTWESAALVFCSEQSWWVCFC